MVFVGIVLTQSVIAAYGGYYSSPADFLVNEEWIRFVLIFAVLFAVIFYASNKAFKENKGVAAVVAIAISLIIMLALVKSGLLYGGLGDTIGIWAIFFGLLLVIALMIKICYGAMGKAAFFIPLLVWVALFLTDFGEIFYQSEWITEIYYIIKGVPGGIVAVIAAIGILYKGGRQGAIVIPHR